MVTTLPAALSPPGCQFGSALVIDDAEDAPVLPAHSPIISGTHAIQAFWHGAVAMGVRGIAIDTLEVSHSGDLAYELGNCPLDMPPEGNQTRQDICTYVVVWKH